MINSLANESNNWQKYASLRVNTYNWKDGVPDVELIKTIIGELHNYSPSKQSIVRYHIDVYRNNNKENCKKIYRGHAASLEENARHNPQVLAPWLLFFRKRETATKKLDFRIEDFYIDLGIAASNIIYSASSKGLDTGLCRCVNYKQELIDVIGYVPELTIGIGYRNNDIKYFCPYYKKIVNIPRPDNPPKPQISEYVTYV